MRAIDILLSSVDMTPKCKTIELPNGKTLDVYVAPLTAKERGQALKVSENAKDVGAWTNALITQKCCDEQGRAMFTPADITELQRSDARLTDLLYAAVMEDEEEEEAPAPKSKARKSA